VAKAHLGISGLTIGLISLFMISFVNAEFQVIALDVSHRARAVHPGEVVVLDVSASEPPSMVLATAFGRTIQFFTDQESGVWRGLIGIDLLTNPGDYQVAISATMLGQTLRTTYMLTVEYKEFPTRNLRVNPSFVNPPTEFLDRIRRESVEVSEIFSVSSDGRYWQDGFVLPVPGEATSSFGRRSIYNGEARSPHSGTDFRAVEGTPIVAPNAGKVAFVGELYFSGNVIILDHGCGLYSYFAHLSAIDVSLGDNLTKRQVIGKVGSTGRVTGPHLHWTVRLNDARVDPMSLISLFPAL
jgi:murein DD-endopeptidase MepM/ murein hydrolase activator NlpD